MRQLKVRQVSMVMHSNRYRHPELFTGQTVALLGAHYSGIDIAFDLSKYAKKVSTNMYK